MYSTRGLPLLILIVEIVVILKTHSVSFRYVERYYFFLPTLAVNILLGLICIVLLMVWFCMLIKRKLLKNKIKFVCTQISHILVVLLIGNTAFFYPLNYYYLVIFSALRAIAPLSFGVYIVISIYQIYKGESLQRPKFLQLIATPTRPLLESACLQIQPNMLQTF